MNTSSPKRWFIGILILFLSLVPAQSASADSHRSPMQVGPVTWYVSTLGSDTNDCQSPASPCQSINAAITLAAEGDTIKVAVGIYTGTGTEVVLINKGLTLSGGWNESFSTRIGTSTIDGEGARRGVTVLNNNNFIDVKVILEYFQIQNGFVSTQGGGLYNLEDLTINNSIIINNTSEGQGGGIYSFRPLNINNSQINGNKAGKINENHFSLGAGIYTGRNTNINNSAIFNNRIIGPSSIPGIYYEKILHINNSTISDNKGGGGVGIYNFGDGTLFINNSTITGHVSFGFSNLGSGSTFLQNSIIAGNGAYLLKECAGKVTSLGHNLIRRNPCFAPAIGDQIGTTTDPIDAKLGPLQDNGGGIPTHALLPDSPAINGGNPETPGGSDTACLTTDQRGIPRPYGSICDIGAFELNYPIVQAVTPEVSSGQDLQVVFTVKFLAPVTGVDMSEPFDDFALTTSGLTSASITSVTGAGDTYSVTVSIVGGTGDGTVRLDVVDNDNIMDPNSTPLGGAGTGNGNFTSGQVYLFHQVPFTLAPRLAITDTTPTYSWIPVPNATEYQYQLMKGADVVYTRAVSSDVCTPTICSDTPANVLTTGNYTWKVQAKIGGSTWADYSLSKAFIESPAKAGFWNGSGVEFYISKTNGRVKNFAIYISVNGCGDYKITHSPFIKINSNAKFSFAGPFYASGTFSSLTKGKGLLGLNNFNIPGCGYLTGGPFVWSTKWKNNSQPPAFSAAAYILPGITTIPEPDIFTMKPFVIEKVEP